MIKSSWIMNYEYESSWMQFINLRRISPKFDIIDGHEFIWMHPNTKSKKCISLLLDQLQNGNGNVIRNYIWIHLDKVKSMNKNSFFCSKLLCTGCDFARFNQVLQHHIWHNFHSWKSCILPTGEQCDLLL